MIKKLNNTVKEIENLLLEIEEITNGAIVDPKTGNILKDEFGNTVFYKDSNRSKALNILKGEFGNTIFYKDSCKLEANNHKLRES